jgi:hypothetical protein
MRAPSPLSRDMRALSAYCFRLHTTASVSLLVASRVLPAPSVLFLRLVCRHPSSISLLYLLLYYALLESATAV